MGKLEWIDKAIESQQAIMQEHEHAPDSEQFIAAKNAYTDLIRLRNEIEDHEIKRDIDLRTMHVKEIEVDAKVDELQSRPLTAIKSACIQVAGSLTLAAGFMLFEASGFSIPTRIMSAVNAVKNKIDNKN